MDSVESSNKQLSNKRQKPRKRAHRQMTAAEIFHLLMDNSIQVVGIVQNGVVKCANNVMAEVSGYSLEELASKSPFDIIHPDDREMVKTYFSNRAQGKKAPNRYYVRIIDKKGNTKWLDRKISSIIWEGKPANIVFDTDITERKQEDEALRRSNRAFKMLSECNQAIVHTSDESTLLNEICRLIVEVGGYNLAWIGVVDSDKKKMIHPVASAGHGKEYLAEINIRLSNTKLERSPAETAIKTGKTCICTDTKEDPNCVPWREAARKYGFQSSIALPLIDGNITFGALSIYSDEQERFNAEEVHLLEELRDDLMYAIAAIRTEIERRKAIDSLRDSEQKYRKFTDQLPQIVCEMDIEGKITLANDNAFKAFGYTREEMELGLTVWQMIVPEDLEVAKKNVLMALGGVDMEGVEYNARRKDGSIFPITTYSSLIGSVAKPTGLRIIAIDITERRQMEQALRESEGKYKLLAESSLTGIFIMQDNRHVYVNNRFAEMHGYKPEEVLGTYYWDFVHLDDRKSVEKRISAHYKGEVTSWPYTVRRLNKDGQAFWVEIMATSISYRGNPAVMGNMIDITERKKAEEALEESEEKYRLLTDSSLTGIFIIQDDKYIYVNNRFAKMHGCKPKELLGTPYWNLLHSDAREPVRENMAALAKGEIPSRPNIVRRLKKDGQLFWVEVIASLIDYHGKPAVMGNMIDITERKKAEEALEESEEKYRSLVEESLTGVFIYDEGRIAFCNDRYAQMHGYEVRELLGKDPQMLVDPSYRQTILELKEKRAAGIPVLEPYEHLRLKKDGTTFWCTARSKLIAYKGKPALLGNVIDITDYREAVSALKESEEKYRILVEGSLTGVSIYVKDKIIFSNDRYAHMHGYTVNEILGMNPKLLIHPKSRDAIDERMKRRLAGHPTEEPIEHMRLKKDGSTFWCEALSKLITYKGELAILGNLIEITGRKEAEEALKESEEKYRTLIEGSLTGVIITQNQKIAFCNERFAEIHGYNIDELLGKGPQTLVHPDYTELTIERASKIYNGQSVEEPFEHLRLRKDGTTLWCQTLIKRIVYNGQPALLGNMIDVTERKRTEESLKESEEKYRTLVDGTLVGIFIYQDGKIAFCNDRYAQMHGYETVELLGKDRLSLIHPSYKDMVAVIMEKGRAGRPEEEPFVHLRLKKDGTAFWCAATSKDITYKGKPALLGDMIDITERKEAEEALKESEEKYRTLVEGALTGVSILYKGEIAFCNDRYAQMHGYQVSELLGKDPQALVHPDYREAVVKRIVTRLAGQSVEGSFEHLRLRKDGTTFWCEAMGQNMVYKGRPAVLNYMIDITERKKAEDALKASEERYRLLAESSLTGIFISQDDLFVYVNQRFAEIHGYEPEELLGKYYWVVIPPEDKEMVRETVRKLHKHEILPYLVQRKRLRKDSSQFWAEQLVSVVTYRDRPAIMGNITDITERKEAEEALKESEERYKLLAESSLTGIFIGRDDKYIYVNKKFAEMHGYKPEELVGKDYWIILPPEDKEKVREILRKLVKHEIVPYLVRRKRLRKDGSLFWTEQLITTIVYQGEPAIMGNLIDITEKMRLEEEAKMMEQKAMLTSRLATVGEMAAGIAHEINNPLTAVIGYVELLSMRGELPEDVKQDIETINGGAKRVADVVRRLLTFARQSKPRRSNVNIKDLIQNTLELRAYHLHTSNVEVTTEFDPELPVIVADAGQLQQVFLNIIINAETEMKLAHDKGHLQIKAQETGNTILVSFKDDGRGIAPENIGKIFDPFFTTREVGEGTGLGLSICHGIVSEHGGRIWVESKPGKGATFFIELPIDIKPEQLPMTDSDTEIVEEVTAMKDTTKTRILVVDDEEVVRDFLNRILSKEGYNLDIVDNAEAALEKVKSEQYRLILLDIKMPGISGIELYQRIKKIDKSLVDKIVFVTGDVMGADTELFLRKTKAPYITKPFYAEQLKKYLGKLLRK